MRCELETIDFNADTHAEHIKDAFNLSILSVSGIGDCVKWLKTAISIVLLRQNADYSYRLFKP